MMCKNSFLNDKASIMGKTPNFGSNRQILSHTSCKNLPSALFISSGRHVRRTAPGPRCGWHDFLISLFSNIYPPPVLTTDAGGDFADSQ